MSTVVACVDSMSHFDAVVQAHVQHNLPPLPGGVSGVKDLYMCYIWQGGRGRGGEGREGEGMEDEALPSWLLAPNGNEESDWITYIHTCVHTYIRMCMLNSNLKS